MIDFKKIWVAMVFINLSVLMANFSGIFPEKWSPYLKGLEDTYNTIQNELKKIQSISEFDIIGQAGAYGFIMLLGLKLVLQILLFAPLYTGATLNNLFSSLGLPAQLGFVFTIISYVSFVIFVADVIRGRWVNAVP